MINTLFQTVYTLVNLCLLRGSAASLPFSWLIFGLLLLVELGLNLYTFNQIKDVSLSDNVLATVLSATLLLGIIYLLLNQRKMQNRFVKVIIAWIGSELLITLLLKLILLILPLALQDNKYMLATLQIGFFTWNIVIKAFILKNATSMKMSSSILVTFGILILYTLPIQMVLGEYLAQSIPQT